VDEAFNQRCKDLIEQRLDDLILRPDVREVIVGTIKIRPSADAGFVTFKGTTQLWHANRVSLTIYLRRALGVE
jgi:hypothetical protein